jgi:hypothetical protein
MWRNRVAGLARKCRDGEKIAGHLPMKRTESVFDIER